MLASAPGRPAGVADQLFPFAPSREATARCGGGGSSCSPGVRNRWHRQRKPAARTRRDEPRAARPPPPPVRGERRAAHARRRRGGAGGDPRDPPPSCADPPGGGPRWGRARGRHCACPGAAPRRRRCPGGAGRGRCRARDRAGTAILGCWERAAGPAEAGKPLAAGQAASVDAWGRVATRFSR